MISVSDSYLFTSKKIFITNKRMLSCYRLLNYPNCPLLPLKLKIIKIKANCHLKKKKQNGFETDKVLPK